MTIKRENLIFKTTDLFPSYFELKHSNSLVMRIAEVNHSEIEGSMKEHQIELPWEKNGTKVSHVFFYDWNNISDVWKKLTDMGEGGLIEVKIKGIDIDKCDVIDFTADPSLKFNENELIIPAQACQSIEFIKGGQSFFYEISKDSSILPSSPIISDTSSAEYSEEQGILIPLETITGEGDAGAIINDGQESSIFVESDMANPLTVRITGIGGKDDTKWRKENRYFARYTIEPVKVETTDSSGDTRSIIIDEIVLTYRIDNFNHEDATEENKDKLIKTQLPNFISDDKERIYNEPKNIGDDLIIKEGSQIKIKLAWNNMSTYFEEGGEESVKRWTSWHLIGGEEGINTYELQIHDDYALEVVNGNELFKSKFNSNSLESLRSQLKSFRHLFVISDSEEAKNHVIELFLSNANQIWEHKKYSELPDAKQAEINIEIITERLELMGEKGIDRETLTYWLTKKLDKELNIKINAEKLVITENRTTEILGTDHVAYKERIESLTMEEWEAEKRRVADLVNEEKKQLLYNEIAEQLDKLCLEKGVVKINSYEDKFAELDFKDTFDKVKKIVQEINELSAESEENNEIESVIEDEDDTYEQENYSYFGSEEDENGNDEDFHSVASEGEQERRDSETTNEYETGGEEETGENEEISEGPIILLIGQTGSGKSALANVLLNQNGDFEEVFRESDRSTSQTKNFQIAELSAQEYFAGDDASLKNFGIIDTLGLNDTKFGSKEAAKKSFAPELLEIIEKRGIKQILFVIGGRFTREEIKNFRFLTEVLFPDQEARDYITIVRTHFPDFEDEEECEKDRNNLLEENSWLNENINPARIIYMDNSPLTGKKIRIGIAKETRRLARKKILDHLYIDIDEKKIFITDIEKRLEAYDIDPEKLNLHFLSSFSWKTFIETSASYELEENRKEVLHALAKTIIDKTWEAKEEGELSQEKIKLLQEYIENHQSQGEIEVYKEQEEKIKELIEFVADSTSEEPLEDINDLEENEGEEELSEGEEILEESESSEEEEESEDEEIESSEEKSLNEESEDEDSSEEIKDEFKFEFEKLSDKQFKYWFVNSEGRKATWKDFIEILKSGGEELTAALKDANSKLAVYFWECIPLSPKTVDQPFEFVITYMPANSISEHNYSSFREYINKNKGEPVCSFPNLEKDATLIIPLPQTGLDYRHISNFVKNSPPEVQNALWKKVVYHLETNLENNKTCWLSTHGTGVYHLHVRVNDLPKYYHYPPYTKIQEQKTKAEELKEKFATLIPMDGGSIEEGVNKGMRTYAEMENIYRNTELTLEQLKELRNLVEEANEVSSECLQKASNGTLCNTDVIFGILDGRIKEGIEREEKNSETTKINNILKGMRQFINGKKRSGVDIWDISKQSLRDELNRLCEEIEYNNESLNSDPNWENKLHNRQKDEGRNNLLNNPPFSDYFGKNKLTAYQASGTNNNCFYNSFSLLLNGDETLASKLRLNCFQELIQDECERFMGPERNDEGFIPKTRVTAEDANVLLDIITIGNQSGGIEQSALATLLNCNIITVSNFHSREDAIFNVNLPQYIDINDNEAFGNDGGENEFKKFGERRNIWISHTGTINDKGGGHYVPLIAAEELNTPLFFAKKFLKQNLISTANGNEERAKTNPLIKDIEYKVELEEGWKERIDNAVDFAELRDLYHELKSEIWVLRGIKELKKIFQEKGPWDELLINKVFERIEEIIKEIKDNNPGNQNIVFEKIKEEGKESLKEEIPITRYIYDFWKAGNESENPRPLPQNGDDEDYEFFNLDGEEIIRWKEEAGIEDPKIARGYFNNWWKVKNIEGNAEYDINLLFNDPNENKGKACYKGQFYSHTQDKRILKFRFAFRGYCGNPVNPDETSAVSDEIIDAYFGKSLNAEQAAAAYCFGDEEKRIPAEIISNEGIARINDNYYDLKDNLDLDPARNEQKSTVLQATCATAVNRNANNQEWNLSTRETELFNQEEHPELNTIAKINAVRQLLTCLREIKGDELDEWTKVNNEINKSQIASGITTFNINHYNNLRNFGETDDLSEDLNNPENFAWCFVDNVLNEVAVNILERYEELDDAWEEFFQGKGEIDTQEKQNAWINSGLNPISEYDAFDNQLDSDAQTAWNNDWRADDPNVTFVKGICSYHQNIGDQVVITNDIDPTRVSKNELQKAHQILAHIAIENIPNNLNGIISQQIDLLDYLHLPENFKDRLIAKMRSRHAFLQQQQQQQYFNPSLYQPFEQQPPSSEPQVQGSAAISQNTGTSNSFTNSTSTSNPVADNDEKISNNSVGNISSDSNWNWGSRSFGSPSSSLEGSEKSTAPTTPSSSRPNSPAASPQPSSKTVKIIEKAEKILADETLPYQPSQIQAVLEELENLPVSSSNKEVENDNDVKEELEEEKKEQLINDLNIKLIQQQPLPEAKKTAEKVITKLLQKEQIKVEDLKISGLSAENDLENYLSKLETSQQIAQLTKQVQQQINSFKSKQRIESASFHNIAPKNNKQGEKAVVLGIVGGAVILGAIGIVIIVKNLTWIKRK